MSSNLNANAEAFFPGTLDLPDEQKPRNDSGRQNASQSWNVSAHEFVPLSSSDDLNACAVDSVVTDWFPALMNANAEEFTPGVGLSEFDQTVEGWQNLGLRLETTFSTEAPMPNVFMINPAFLSDDESDDEICDDVVNKDLDKGNVDADQESNDGNQGSNASTFDIFDDFATKDSSNYGDTESTGENPECNESVYDIDKESNDGTQEHLEVAKGGKIAGFLPYDSDKETNFNDGSDDPQTSSADESISLGTASDVEFPDQASLPLKAPPGLSLPPWKVRPRATEAYDSSENESASVSDIRKTSPYRSRPWKLPPWKKGAKEQVSSEGQAASPVSSPPWRKAKLSDVTSEAARPPPGLNLPPWKLPGWKQASKGEAAAELKAEDEGLFDQPASRIPAWRR